MNTFTQTKKNAVYLLIVAFVLLAVVAVIAIMERQPQEQNINSFDDCVAAGYPVQESYPEKCSTSDGRSFTNDRQLVLPNRF